MWRSREFDRLLQGIPFGVSALPLLTDDERTPTAIAGNMYFIRRLTSGIP
jgi:hypothetical protein